MHTIKLFILIVVFFNVAVIFNTVTAQNTKTSNLEIIDKRALNHYTKDDIKEMAIAKVYFVNWLFTKSYIIPDEYKNVINEKNIDIFEYTTFRDENQQVKVYVSPDGNIEKAASVKGAYIILKSHKEVRNVRKKIEQRF